jgi:hypothetical protein
MELAADRLVYPMVVVGLGISHLISQIVPIDGTDQQDLNGSVLSGRDLSRSAAWPTAKSTLRRNSGAIGGDSDSSRHRTTAV